MFSINVALFYWILLNLDPHLRFSLNNIQLLACASSQILREGGIDLLADFIFTINIFGDTGFTFNYTHYFGCLAFCMGDTLALQWLGGFLEGVGKAKRL